MVHCVILGCGAVRRAEGRSIILRRCAPLNAALPQVCAEGARLCAESAKPKTAPHSEEKKICFAAHSAACTSAACDCKKEIGKVRHEFKF